MPAPSKLTLAPAGLPSWKVHGGLSPAQVLKSSESITPEERDQALVLIRTSPGVADALDVARSYADKATSALSGLPDNPGSAALRTAAEHLVNRVTAPLV